MIDFKSGYEEVWRVTYLTVLEQAAELVGGDRQRDYGHPIDNHGCTAALFTAYLRRKTGLAIELDAEDVCWLNALQKISRQANVRQRDNLVDVAGYVANVEMLALPRPAPEAPPLAPSPHRFEQHRTWDDEEERQASDTEFVD